MPVHLNARDRHREADRQGPDSGPPDDANTGSSERAARSGSPEKAADSKAVVGYARAPPAISGAGPQHSDKSEAGEAAAIRRADGFDEPFRGCSPSGSGRRYYSLRLHKDRAAEPGVPGRSPTHEQRLGSPSGSDRAAMAVIRGLGPSCFWGEPRRGARFEELCIGRGGTGQAFPVEGLSVRTGAPVGGRRSGS